MLIIGERIVKVLIRHKGFQIVVLKCCHCFYLLKVFAIVTKLGNRTSENELKELVSNESILWIV